jgi:hypothetical protein
VEMWWLTDCRMGEIARDEVEMKKCWKDVWEVLRKEGQVKDIEGGLEA